jgi:hypothetical protein
MSSRTLYRLSGGTLIAASLLIVISAIVGAVLFPGHSSAPQVVTSPPWLLLTLITLIGSLLFVIGLPGMYLRQAERAGTLGIVGFILLFFGILLEGAAFSATQVIALPYLAQVAPQSLTGNSGPVGVFLLLIISGLLHIIGAVLLGIATMRARVFPRWAGILLIVAGVTLLLTLPPLPDILSSILEAISFIAFSLAFIGCGYALVTRETAAVEGTSPSAHVGVQASR